MPVVSPSRVDPTRTGPLRRRFEASVRAAFARLRADVLGYDPGRVAPVGNAKYEFASTQLDVTDPDALEALAYLRASLDPADVVRLEDEPHVTIRYGLHDEADAPGRVEALVKQNGPVTVKVTGLSIFRQPDADVLKYSVESPALRRLNGLLGLLPNTQKYRYSPHMTVAYMRPGTGQKYLDRFDPLAGSEMTFDRLSFSDPDGFKQEVSLNFDAAQTRDAIGRFARSAGAAVSSRKERVGRVASRLSGVLPPRLKSAAGVLGKLYFSSFIAGNKAVRAVAKERGMSPQHVERLGKIVGGLDLALGGSRSAAAATALGFGSVALPASMVPWASVGYLAYSTARNPMATLRAAKNAVLGRVRRADPTANEMARGDVDRVAQKMAEHGWSDWYAALVSAAIDETGHLGHALLVADEAFAAGDPGEVEAATDDADAVFGREQTRNAYAAPDEQQLDEFRQWLRSRMAQTVEAESEADLWRRYVEDGFRQGAGRAFDDATAAESVLARSVEGLDFYRGTRGQFLASAFARPVAVEKVRLLASRSLAELSNVSADMATKMTRLLADGLVKGQSPRDIARVLAAQVDLSKERALVVARTEIIRAHAEGQLEAFDQLGVEELGVAVEWTTAGDARVCRACAPLAGAVFKIDEARGMLPRHPNCRCAWLPAGVGEARTGQTIKKRDLDRVVRESRKAGSDDLWAPARKISADRPAGVTGNALHELEARMRAWVENDAWKTQPRVPSGSPEGGQWTDGGGAGRGHTIHESEVSHWLKDSVNKDVTYHATSADGAASISRHGVDVEKSTAGALIFGQGFYTSTSKADAVGQANVPGASVVRVAIKTERPFDLVKDPSKWAMLGELSQGSDGSFTTGTQAIIRKNLIAKGYDSVIMPGAGGAKVVVALKNDLVKVVSDRVDNDWTKQRRVPAGRPDGGEWTIDGGGSHGGAETYTRQSLRDHLAKVPPGMAHQAVHDFLDRDGHDGGTVKRHGMAEGERTRKVTIEGVDVHWKADDPVSKAHAAVTLANMFTGPDAVPDRLWKSNKSVTFTTQKNSADAYWEKEYGMAGFRSAATGGDNHVVIYNTTISTSTFAHESGHNLAYDLYDGTRPTAKATPWTPVVDRKAATDYYRAQKRENPVTTYGSKSPAEDFAEAAAMYTIKSKSGNPESPHDRLKREFPLKYDALRRIIGD